VEPIAPRARALYYIKPINGT